MSQIIIAVVITAVIVAFLSWNLAIAHRKKTYESKIGSAEARSREIIEEALKTAETKKREALLEAKEESLRTKNELERETKERRAELQHYENRVLSKEENLDKKQAALEKREAALVSKEEKINERSREVDSLYDKGIAELERIAGLSTEEAKEFLLQSVEEDVKHDTARLIKELEAEAREEADKKAREYVVSAIQRCAADSVAESTVSVVQLPNDEMKGRIIGREGRNIRALEQLTGVELIVDDTPEAVVLSGFDPVRREVARVALEKLITDGRIHPARIEEMVVKAQKEVETTMREEGEAAVLEAGVHGIHPELVKLLGRMKYRTSYGQNALKHSIEVAELSGHLAAEVGVTLTAPLSHLSKICGDCIASQRTIHFLPPYRHDTKIQLMDLLGIHPSQQKDAASLKLIKSVVKMRSTKTAEEIAYLEAACDVGYVMHTTAQLLIKPGVTERFVAGQVDGIA